MDDKRYFYCYSPNLHKFLRYKKKIKYIATGLNSTTKKRFWQYLGDDKLNEALDEWRKGKSITQ